MNYWLLLLTFVSVNLDFFFILLFLVKKYRMLNVILGYLLGTCILLTASFAIGSTLSQLLPEWLLGTLGIWPIYMAFDDDDEPAIKKHQSEILSVLITYLSVCTGCTLSIFLPVLIGTSTTSFIHTILFIGLLTILMVILIRFLSKNRIISAVMEKYGEYLTKICYIFVGLYVFWDSGLIKHIIEIF